MKTENEITMRHEMRLGFESTDIALTCYRYMKEKGLASARMDWQDGKVFVIVSKQCSIGDWIKILESFN